MTGAGSNKENYQFIVGKTKSLNLSWQIVFQAQEPYDRKSKSVIDLVMYKRSKSVETLAINPVCEKSAYLAC